MEVHSFFLFHIHSTMIKNVALRETSNAHEGEKRTPLGFRLAFRLINKKEKTGKKGSRALLSAVGRDNGNNPPGLCRATEHARCPLLPPRHPETSPKQTNGERRASRVPVFHDGGDAAWDCGKGGGQGEHLSHSFPFTFCGR